MGKAERLRGHHGMSREDALHFAKLILNPYSRCCVCGIPSRILLAYWRLGWRLWGRSGLLHADHEDPWGSSERTNVRLLCGLCNGTRGAALHTDQEVLIRVTRRYEGVLMRPELWWLNTSPGRGGLSRRGRRHEEEVLRGPALKADGPDASDGPRALQGRGDPD